MKICTLYSISINSSKENPEHRDPSSMKWCLMMPPWLRKVQLPLKKLSLNNNALEKNIPCKLPVVLPRKTFRRWIRWIVLGTVNAQEAILHIRHLLHHNFTQIPEKQHEYEEFVPRSKRKPGLLDGHLLWEMHIALALKKTRLTKTFLYTGTTKFNLNLLSFSLGLHKLSCSGPIWRKIVCMQSTTVQ